MGFFMISSIVHLAGDLEFLEKIKKKPGNGGE